ncbi:MAG: hypothetical protein JWN04_4618, partial [Myxococcaceae bacterium]|nr:hypothetical protein [Myxococcaceae bacterium]
EISVAGGREHGLSDTAPSVPYRSVFPAPTNTRVELIDGVSHRVSGRSADDHLIESLQSAFMEHWGRQRNADIEWQPEIDPLLQLGDDIVAPDACAWRMKELPPTITLRHDGAQREARNVAPAWVLEILTSDTAELVREKKLAVYLNAGVATVWLLDPQQRVFEVLEATPHGFRRSEVHGEHGVVRAHPLSALELDMDALWDSDRQKAVKLRDKVERLGRALQQAEDAGVSQDALFIMLLKNLSVEPSPFDSEWGVAAQMMRSRSVLLRARVLVQCRTPVERAREIAREELAADDALDKLSERQARVLCEQYCELLDVEGHQSERAGELAKVAHAWARRQLEYWWHPRVERRLLVQDKEQSLSGLRDLRQFHKTGRLSLAARALVLQGPGAWLVSFDGWRAALAAVVAELVLPSDLDTSSFEPLLAELRRHLPESPEEAALRNRIDDTARAWLDDIRTKARETREARGSVAPKSRTKHDDIALQWRDTRRQLSLEFAELRRTGKRPESLDLRFATGEGLGMVTADEWLLLGPAYDGGLLDDVWDT